MSEGTEKLRLSTGTVCTVKWRRPDITDEECQRLMENFAKVWLEEVSDKKEE